MDNKFYVIGGFPYFFATVHKIQNLGVKTLIYEIEGANKKDRLLHTLNNTFVEKCRNWYLYNGFIKL